MTDVFKDSTSHSYYFELVDSTTGLPKTGILYSDVVGSYVRTRAARTAITMATLASASAAYSSGGFILVDDTNQPGVYRFDIPDAAFATGVDEVIVTVKATGCRTQSRKFTLVNINNQIAYAPNATANANGGLPILSSSGTTLDYTLSTLTTYTGNTPQTADHTANIAEILVDTNELQTDWVDGGRLDLILDTRSSQSSVDGLPTNAELATALGTSDDATLAAVEVLRKLLRADHYIDNSTTPWALVYMEEGTGGIGVGVEIFRKQLKSIAGVNLTSTDTVVGQAKT